MSACSIECTCVDLPTKADLECMKDTFELLGYKCELENILDGELGYVLTINGGLRLLLEDQPENLSFRTCKKLLLRASPRDAKDLADSIALALVERTGKKLYAPGLSTPPWCGSLLEAARHLYPSGRAKSSYARERAGAFIRRRHRGVQHQRILRPTAGPPPHRPSHLTSSSCRVGCG
jgi:hypothetical protein